MVGTTLFTRKEPNGHDQHPNGHDQYFDAPVNVDQRLANMTHEGPGDTGIHKTQLQVTSALIGRGMSLEFAVLTVLEETQKAVGAQSWDWDKERLLLERQCYDWIY